ncbi:MAG: enoyl-CoA hydratase-related protein, partial [Actinomycetota bacterium]|nr:enoyl-CoA hydratase-related protein [Actinomycetota bacterium]
MALHETIADGVATVVMDNPPVNALGIADTYALADLFDGYGNRTDVRSVILTAKGHGFCAGVDIKEIQALPGNEGI